MEYGCSILLVSSGLVEAVPSHEGQRICWFLQRLGSPQQGPGPPTHESMGWTAVYTSSRGIPDVEQGKVLVFA